jgi:serine-type D-Ala-D-Ala carboxypeptidase/endopeptidase (penicillin-binding protein 4)
MYTLQRESKEVALGLRPENRYTPMNRSSGTRQTPVCDARNIMGVGAMVLCTALLTASALFSATPDLEHRIDALVDASGPAARGFVGIHVVELAGGKTVYQRNQDKLFMPASNMKLFTSALALLRLGTDYRFTTQVIRDASGDVVLVGSGDPSLCGRVFPYRKGAAPRPALAAIEDLADQLVSNGLRAVTGDIVGDDRLYPWVPYAPSWTQDDALREFGAPVSALTVNDNTISLTIRGGASAGDDAEITVDPAIEYYAIDNRLATIGHGSEPKIRMSRPAGTSQVLLWGSIPAGVAVTESVAIDDPAYYAACALYDALLRRGVSIRGRPVARHRLASEDYDPAAGTVVASRVSPPMTDLLQVMDKVSQNLYAELMLREVGRYTRHQGTREAGLEEMDAMMHEIHAEKDDWRLEDGSGLSRNAMVTPRAFTRLLAAMHAGTFRDAWMNLLPVGGEDGTLSHRLCCAAGGAGIRAKTGSLSRALALSGYADSKTRGRLAFSILVNDFSAPSNQVRAWIDKIAMSLLE